MEDEHGSSALTEIVSAQPIGRAWLDWRVRTASVALAVLVSAIPIASLVAWALANGAGWLLLGEVQSAMAFVYFGTVPVGIHALFRRFGLERALSRWWSLGPIQSLLDTQVAALRQHAESPIARSEPGLVHIRGRVRVLSSVTSASGEPLAAYSGATGHFAIVDESGTAIVDDDMVELWPADASKLGLVQLREGDEVEVIGTARREQTKDAPSGAYRAAGEALVFEGTPDANIHIIEVEPASKAPRVRIDRSIEDDGAELGARRSDSSRRERS